MGTCMGERQRHREQGEVSTGRQGRREEQVFSNRFVDEVLTAALTASTLGRPFRACSSEIQFPRSCVLAWRWIDRCCAIDHGNRLLWRTFQLVTPQLKLKMRCLNVERAVICLRKTDDRKPRVDGLTCLCHTRSGTAAATPEPHLLQLADASQGIGSMADDFGFESLVSGRPPASPSKGSSISTYPAPVRSRQPAAGSSQIIVTLFVDLIDTFSTRLLMPFVPDSAGPCCYYTCTLRSVATNNEHTSIARWGPSQRASDQASKAQGSDDRRLHQARNNQEAQHAAGDRFTLIGSHTLAPCLRRLLQRERSTCYRLACGAVRRKEREQSWRYGLH